MKVKQILASFFIAICITNYAYVYAGAPKEDYDSCVSNLDELTDDSDCAYIALTADEDKVPTDYFNKCIDDSDLEYIDS